MTHSFKPAWIRQGLQCLTVVSLLLSQACSDDDSDGTDKTAPQISFTNLTDGQTVRNTVNASLTASDDKGIQKVDIYVDGTLLTSLKAEPFEATWDTKNTTDGQHIIKAVATDMNGNTVEKSITVSVSNILVTLNIEANQLASGVTPERGFVFLSDADGKLIAFTEYKNGQKIELKSEGFDSESFFLTEVYVNTSNEVTVSTFASVERGKNWTIATDWYKDDEYPAIGNATLNYINIEKGAYYNVYAGTPDFQGSSALVTDSKTSSPIELRKSPTTLFVRRQTPALYNLFPGLTTGSTYTLDFSKVTNPMTYATAEVPEYIDGIGYSIRGYLEGDYNIGYSVFSSSNSGATTFDYYYPGNAFSAYTSVVEAIGDGFALIRQTNTTELNAEKPEAAVDFTFSNNKLTVSTTGVSMDAVSVLFENDDATWYYFLPQGKNQIIPSLEIPELLKTWSLPGLAIPQQYDLYDFDAIDNYNDLKTHLRGAATYGFNRLFDYGKAYVDLTYYDESIGRKATPAGRNSLAGRSNK